MHKLVLEPHNNSHEVPVSSRVARWLSSKYRTLAVPVSVTQNIELFTHALSGITVIFIPDKEPKYRTVRLNTGHLATQPVTKLL